jgi:anthranilate synthase component 2
MAEVFGAQVLRAKRLMHGKVSQIHHDGQGVFKGIASPMIATRYHSLVVPEESLNPELIACGWTRDADHPPEIMALRHRRYPVHGVQFHPESFLTQDGIILLKNFLAL